MSDLLKQKIKITEICRDWTESMSMHGFPNIFRTKYHLIRILWTFCILISAGFCFYIISKNIINYLNYEVVTTIRVVDKDSMPFPAVTVCNANSFVTNQSLKYVSNFLQENQLTNLTNVDLGVIQGEISRLKFNLIDLKYLLSLNLKSNTSEFRKNLSIPFEQMLISCFYNFEPCDTNDWEWYYDYTYGNCYRFNTGKNTNGQKTEIKTSNYPGKFNGLMIELYVGIPNDQNTLSLTTGAHIYVDDNLFKPTYGQGFGVSPGFSTDIALERINTKQMPKPYSECIENIGSIDSFDSEYYRKVIRSNLTYRQSECLNSYFYFEIKERCNCGPMDNNFVVDEKNPCDTIEEHNCVSEVTLELFLSNSKSKIKSLCPLECESNSFRILKSENRYPSESYGNDLIKTKQVKELFGKRSNVSNEELRKNILAVNVYYEYLKQTEISECASISWDGLLGNVGGNLGLFLGMSVLSLVEFIDLFFQVIFKKIGKDNVKISAEN